jgi:hypothetical protein
MHGAEHCNIASLEFSSCPSSYMSVTALSMRRPNGKTNKRWIGKDAEGNRYDLFEDTIPNFAWRYSGQPQ